MSAHEMNNGRRQSGDYAALQNVLDEAFLQSAEGKGNARHANDKPFDKQPILEIGRMVGPGFAAGQIMKKAQEAIGMAARGETEAAANELLGAIVYAASAVVLVREKGVSLAMAANAHLFAVEADADISAILFEARKPGDVCKAIQSPDASRLVEPDVALRPFKVGDRVDIVYASGSIRRGRLVSKDDESRWMIDWDGRGPGALGHAWHEDELIHVD